MHTAKGKHHELTEEQRPQGDDGGGGGSGALRQHGSIEKMADLVAWTCEVGSEQRRGAGGRVTSSVQHYE